MKICAIIPCFNEEDSIVKIYSEVCKYVSKSDILVINDGSTDDSGIILDNSRIQNLLLLENLGIGGAIQLGYKWALANDYDAVMQIDGDGQHLASEIPVLISKFLFSNGDLIIGSRNLDIKSLNTTLLRRIGTKLINAFINICYPSSKITDSTSGFRLVSKKLFTLYSTNYPPDYPEPISVAMALQKKYKVVETGVAMQKRRNGQSSIKWWHQLTYMIKVVGYIFIIKVRLIKI
jgi:glycosyltransferase involved in cell wall biosynthesis